MGLPLVAAGVSAIGSLIGGRRAAKEQRRAIAAQNAYNHPSAIRARAEAAGFNPLLFVGPGVGNQTALEQPVMGQAIANAGLAIASGMMEQAEMQAQQSAVMQQNAELRKKLENLTLRPPVPGIFGNGGGVGSSEPVSVPAATPTDKVTVKPVASIVPSAGLGINAAGPARYPGQVDTSGRVEEPTPLWQGYESDGQVVWLPEGPDADELASGLALAKVLKVRNKRITDDFFTRLPRFDPFHRDGYYRSGPYSGN